MRESTDNSISPALLLYSPSIFSLFCLRSACRYIPTTDDIGGGGGGGSGGGLLVVSTPSTAVAKSLLRVRCRILQLDFLFLSFFRSFFLSILSLYNDDAQSTTPRHIACKGDSLSFSLHAHSTRYSIFGCWMSKSRKWRDCLRAAQTLSAGNSQSDWLLFIKEPCTKPSYIISCARCVPLMCVRCSAPRGQKVYLQIPGPSSLFLLLFSFLHAVPASSTARPFL